jgi:hypothetical protein
MNKATPDEAGLAHSMQIGINYPWLDYGWDFGDPPPGWAGTDIAAWRAQKRQRIVTDLRRFAELGLFAVRWFVLCDGLSYGTGDDAPQLVNGQWRFHALPRAHSFHQQLGADFEFVLQTCAQLNLKLVPSLIDFHWCHQATAVSPGVIKGGRYDLVRNERASAEFFDHVLEPLLDVSMHYPEAIYAWELINEPEWVTETRSLFKLGTNANETVTQDEMLQFLAEGIGRINNRRLPGNQPAFRSTVGFAHWDSLADWDSAGLGVTLHQFHYYAQDDRRIPRHHFSGEYPCFIGEFATTVHKCWPELRRADATQPIAARLRCVAEKGYPAAFLWSARATDEATTWTDDDQQTMVSFVNAERPMREDAV